MTIKDIFSDRLSLYIVNEYIIEVFQSMKFYYDQQKIDFFQKVDIDNYASLNLSIRGNGKKSPQF